jgi:Peptidase M66
MSRLSHVCAVVLLTLGACVGNVMEADQRIGAGFSLDAGNAPADDGATWLLDAGPNLVPGSAGGGVQANAAGLSGGGLAGPGAPAGAGGVDAGAPDGTLASTSNQCGDGAEPLVGDVRIRELSLYQTVKIALYKDNAWVTARNASVVQGKKTLLRTFVEPLSGYRQRPVRALLTLDNDGQQTQLSAEKTVTAASTDENAASTLDFSVDGSLIGPNTQLSVALLETSCPPQPSVGNARVPASGLAALGAVRIGTLRVVLVPVSVGGRMPDMSEAQLAKIRDELLAYYPVAAVEVTSHTPLSWTSALSASGSGWADLLDQIGIQRQRDAPARDIYYFGLVAPTASFSEYCRGGCVLGLAPQTTFISPPDQIGLGVGFVNANTYSTVVHEIGHAHGRAHAPCVPPGGTIQAADSRFPYAGGKIGSWGWDSRSGALLSPTRYIDVMGYCDPTWISDFNYEALATRSRNVNNAASLLVNKNAPRRWQRVILFADGRARWSAVSTDEAPTDQTSARAFDAAGADLGEVPVARVPLSHSADAFMYVPDPDPRWARLELGDRTLVMSQIEAAR